MASKVLLACGVATLSIGLLLNIVGMATPDWSVLHTDEKFDIDYHVTELGPWKWCDPNDCDHMDLDKFDDATEWLEGIKSIIESIIGLWNNKLLQSPGVKVDVDIIDNITEWLENITSIIESADIKVDVDIIDSDDVRAVQACTVLGALLTAASLVVAVLMAFTKKDKLRFVTGGLGVLADVFIIIGVAYWYTSIQENLDDLARVVKRLQFSKDVSFDLGYSFAISCVSAVFVLVGSVCTGMYDD